LAIASRARSNADWCFGCMICLIPSTGCPFSAGAHPWKGIYARPPMDKLNIARPWNYVKPLAKNFCV
jgi:hypothetical protein